MNSRALPQFWSLYRQLPPDIRQRAVKTYQIWQTHPRSSGLRFKQVGKRSSVYSVRINDSYRALGMLEEDTIFWFWIGPHDEYERLIRSV